MYLEQAMYPVLVLGTGLDAVEGTEMLTEILVFGEAN